MTFLSCPKFLSERMKFHQQVSEILFPKYCIWNLFIRNCWFVMYQTSFSWADLANFTSVASLIDHRNNFSYYCWQFVPAEFLWPGKSLIVDRNLSYTNVWTSSCHSPAVIYYLYSITSVPYICLTVRWFVFLGGPRRKPIDCQVSKWTSWTQCSVTCGTGTIVKTRNVLQLPARGGKPCRRLIKFKKCIKSPCPGKYFVFRWYCYIPLL